MRFLFLLLFLIGTTRAGSQGKEHGAGDQLRIWVEQLAQSPRTPKKPETLHRCAEWIEEKWLEIGVPVERQPIETGQGTFHNLITFVGPPHGPRFVIGAHYDTVAGSIGADDNASGVAVLLMLTKQLKARGERLPYRFDLVAFVLEESPYTGTDKMGSMVYCKALKDAGVSVKGMISLEMVGYFNDEVDSQSFPSSHFFELFGTRGNFIAIVGRLGLEDAMAHGLAKSLKRAMGIPVFPFLMPKGSPAIYRSDHIAFWKHQFPAVMISDTANYRNPHYHKPGDKPETLDFVRMAILTSALVESLQMLAAEP